MNRRVFLCCLLALTTCGGNDDGERRVVVADLVADVVLPALDDVVARTGELATATSAFAAAPDEPTLEAARTAWRTARTAWKETDAFAFGPADDLRLAAAMDQPIDPGRVEQDLAGAAVIDEPFVENLGANRKGFHAIEYLLFAPDALTAFAEQRRRDLIVAFTANLQRKAGELRTAWDEYGAALAEPGNATFPSVKSAVDAFVNEIVFKSELLADLRLGTPMGLATGGTPQPDLQESGPSDNSIADMASALRGTRNILEGSRDGTPGKGIAKLLEAQNADVAARVREAHAAAVAAVDAIPRPYRDAVNTGAPQLATAHAAIKELKRLLATEVVATLGVTLGFNDNDGD